jgi:hypothetical protein
MSNLDDRVGQDPCGLEAGIIARAERLAGRPEKLAAFVNGLVLQGVASASVLSTGLAPSMTVPPPEGKKRTRARMARAIEHCFSLNQRVTREDLEAAGFSGSEILEHSAAAARIARIADMEI